MRQDWVKEIHYTSNPTKHQMVGCLDGFSFRNLVCTPSALRSHYLDSTYLEITTLFLFSLSLSRDVYVCTIVHSSVVACPWSKLFHIPCSAAWRWDTDAASVPRSASASQSPRPPWWRSPHGSTTDGYLWEWTLRAESRVDSTGWANRSTDPSLVVKNLKNI